MSTVRETFLAAAQASRSVIMSPAVETRWHDKSALAQFTVGALAGHMARAAIVVETYLNAPVPPADAPVSAAEYYSRMLNPDLTSGENLGVVQRGEELAVGGPSQLVTSLGEVLQRLRKRLPEEPADRVVKVAGGNVMLLNEYLVTRIIELTIHCDDLAASVGDEVPNLPAEATGATIRTLIDLARLRHGDLAVMRALTRRERAHIDLLRAM